MSDEAQRATKLTLAEVYGAAQIGVMRQVASMQSDSQPRAGGPDMPWQANIEGALAERAFAKFLGIYWPGTVNAHSAPDVGPYEIRCRHREGDPLIIRPNDKDDATYVLLIGQNGRYRVIGSILGRLAKRPEWFGNPTSKTNRPPAYFVPQAALTPWPLPQTLDDADPS